MMVGDLGRGVNCFGGGVFGAKRSNTSSPVLFSVFGSYTSVGDVLSMSSIFVFLDGEWGGVRGGELVLPLFFAPPLSLATATVRSC